MSSDTKDVVADSRYPYTLACDFVRGNVTDLNVRLNMQLPSISRSEASRALECIAKAIGMTHEELACKVADFAKAAGVAS